MRQCLFFGSWLILFFGLIHRLSLWCIYCFLRKNQTVNQILMSLRVTVKVLVSQLCLILCNPMDCRLPGSSDHGILQARILEWVSPSLLQGIFPTLGLKLGLPHWRKVLYHLSHQGSPWFLIAGAKYFKIKWRWLDIPVNILSNTEFIL